MTFTMLILFVMTGEIINVSNTDSYLQNMTIGWSKDEDGNPIPPYGLNTSTSALKQVILDPPPLPEEITLDTLFKFPEVVSGVSVEHYITETTPKWHWTFRPISSSIPDIPQPTPSGIYDGTLGTKIQLPFGELGYIEYFDPHYG